VKLVSSGFKNSSPDNETKRNDVFRKKKSINADHSFPFSLFRSKVFKSRLILFGGKKIRPKRFGSDLPKKFAHNEIGTRGNRRLSLRKEIKHLRAKLGTYLMKCLRPIMVL